MTAYEDYVSAAKKRNEQHALQARQQKEQAQQLAQIKNSQAVSDGNAQIAGLEDKYRTIYDENAINQYIGQRRVAENMANLGLTDSGLNRTQQTALQVVRGNADHATRMNYESAVRAVEKSVRDEIAANNLAATEQVYAIDKQVAADSADRLYNAEIKQMQVNAENQQKQAQAEKDAAKEHDGFIDKLAGALKLSRQTGITSFELSEILYDYIVRYNLSQSDAELIMTSAGIAPQRLGENYFVNALRDRDRWQTTKADADRYLAGECSDSDAVAAFKRSLKIYNVEQYGADKLLPKLQQEGYLTAPEVSKIKNFYGTYIGGSKKYSSSAVSSYISKQLSSGSISNLAANYMLALYEYHNK